MFLDYLVKESNLTSITDRPLEETESLLLFPSMIVLYSNERNNTTIWEQDAIDKNNNKKMFGGHFYIRTDGTIYRGRDINVIGEFAYSKDDMISINQGNTIGVCIEGDFNTDYLLAAQETSIINLVNALKKEFPFITKVLYLNQLNYSNNPGYLFPFASLLSKLGENPNNNLSIIIGGSEYIELGARDLLYLPYNLMTGTDVYYLNMFLYKYGYLSENKLNFIFDYATREGLKKFQLSINREPTGIVDSITASYIKLYINKLYTNNYYDRIIFYDPLDDLMYGHDIDKVQEMLNLKNYKCTKTGVYDDETAKCIKQFQADNRITVDGKIGPITWNLLNAMNDGSFRELYIKSPCFTGTDVELIQNKLKDLGYSVILTGEYDDVTSIQIKLFQLKNGLQPTGTVDKETFDRIFK